MYKIVLLASFVIPIIAALIIRHKVYYHFRVVEEGKLYRSGFLSRIGLYSVCRKYRIKTIIALMSEKELANDSRFRAEVQYCRKNNIKLLNIPLKTDTPPEAEQVRRFLRVCTSPDFQPVLVRCDAGVIRTNMMVAIYLKNRFNTSNGTILRNLPFWGHDIYKRPKVKNFILGYKKEPRDTVSKQDSTEKTHVICKDRDVIEAVEGYTK